MRLETGGPVVGFAQKVSSITPLTATPVVQLHFRSHKAATSQKVRLFKLSFTLMSSGVSSIAPLVIVLIVGS